MFQSARYKLTAWYLTIIMVISLAFSAVIYNGLTHEVERFARGQRFFIERRLRDTILVPPEITIIDPDLVAETKHRIIVLLFMINGSILLLSGGLAYMLAGRTLRPIEDMMEEQNRFISDSSHELKTPLTSLKSAFEVHLRDKKRTLKSSDTVVRESIAEVDKLQSLSESLLTLAHYQQHDNHAKMETVSIRSVMDTAIKDVSPMAAKKHITIQNSVSDTSVRAHTYSLIRLFVILLDNAIKYSKNNGTVTISDKKTKGYVIVCVKDRGIGISESDLPHIFERFFRADSARSKAGAGGYGLGLSIAKKIVDEHNGNIEVQSDGESGSSFIIRLPVFS